MCGYGRPMTLKQGINLVTVEDTNGLIRHIHSLVTGRSTMIDMECRVRQKGKSPKWIRIKGKGGVSEEGKCLRIAGSLSDIDEQRSSEEKLIRAAMYDLLTGLPNRLYLMERLQQIMENNHRDPGRHFALLFLDYDGFKKVNDTYGHAAGDAIMRLISQRLLDQSAREFLIDGSGRVEPPLGQVPLPGHGHIGHTLEQLHSSDVSRIRGDPLPFHGD